jgi:putative ABC transport system permease protein
MNWNDFKLALRVHQRQKMHSIITILGLASGIMLSVFLFQYVIHETSFDQHHQLADRTYRVAVDMTHGDTETETARSGWELLPTMQEHFPQIENAVRMTFQRNLLISHGDRSYRIEMMCTADTTIFDVFNLPLEEGDPNSVISDSNQVCITREAAVALFGDEDPIGKSISINNSQDVMVTGILGEIDDPSHFEFQMLSGLTYWETPGHPANGWFLLAFHTYFVMPEGASADPIIAGIQPVIDETAAEWFEMTGNHLTATILPLPDVHLKSDKQAEILTNGDMYRVLVFGSIGLLIILIACINFINLATARSTRRAAEVGLRKVVGARKDELIRQFFGESALLALVAFIIAYIAIELLLPVFNNLFGLELLPGLIKDPMFLMAYVGLYVVVTFLSGLGPALVFSSFKPVDVIKGQVRQGPIGRRVRQTLVVVQFAVSVVLIVGTLVVFRQMQYLNSQDLGFQKDHILVMTVQNSEIREQLESMKDRLVEHSAIHAASASTSVPGRHHAIIMVLPEGLADDDVRLAAVIPVDKDFMDTYQIEMVEGRFFSDEFPADSAAFVINDLAVAELGWENPIGMEYDFPPRGDDNEGPVIGVFKAYHHLSLHDPMQPMVFHQSVFPYNYLSVRFDGRDLEGALAHVGLIWSEFAPEWPFEYFFVDEDYAEQYSADRRFGELFLAFASFTVFIACLGLFGLAAYVAQARTKEIGLRKVLGASVGSIVVLLSKEFVILVIISNAIAWPLAWYLMNRWLGSFEATVGVEPLVFAIAGLVTLLIAFLTVSGQAVRAALTRPADTLRVE